MNCFIWILLLLGCSSNCGNSFSTWNNGCCDNRMNRCGCNDNWNGNDNWGCNSTWDNDNNCGCNNNMIQPRDTEDCGCEHHHHNNWQNSNDCGCQNMNNWDNGRDGNNRFMNNNFMTPPPVPGRIRNDDDCDCGCND